MAQSKAIKFHEYQSGSEDFGQYVERLKYCFYANGVTENSAQLANFYTVCGAQVYQTLLALITPLRSNEITFEQAITSLTRHYQPDTNEITMSYRFYKRNQNAGEKACDYITELRKLGAQCNFKDLERSLRDRLVCGMSDERLQFELLRRDKISYQEVVDAMLTAETAAKDVILLRSTSTTDTPTTSEPMDVGAVRERGGGASGATGFAGDTRSFSGTASRNYRFCYRCGDKHSGVCRHINTTCNYCHKKGHLEKICTAKKKGFSKKVNFTGEDHSDELACLNSIYLTSDNGETLVRVPPMEVKVCLNGVETVMQVDSGASYTLINLDTYRQLPMCNNKLQPLEIKLSTWTNAPVPLLGKVKVKVQYNSINCDLVVVVAKGRGPNLLGRDWFVPLGITMGNINNVVNHSQSTTHCQDLIDKYKDIFLPGLGTYRGEPVSIQLSPGATSKFMKARPVPYALKERVEHEIDNMVAEGVLKPIPYSKWATPVVPIVKKNGNIRLCGDYRSTVNQATESDTHPMPTANEIFALLAGGTCFTTLDLDRAYTQVTVDDETAKLLTLNTCKGLFSVHRLAFGVKASPGIFQRIMTSLLAKIPGVAVLLDDIIVTGTDYKEMHSRLDLVLNQISQAGLRLNREKCKFAKERVEFLGFIVDADDIHPAPSKIEAIVRTPPPRNIQELQAFLGLYNFYERFVPHKATVLEPLHRLLDKTKGWKWTSKEQTAFDTAKNLLTTDICLTHYDTKRELILTCDSSEYGVGSVLAHVMDNREEKPIAMGSRTLHPHERHYSQLDKEATAILFGVKKFHNYLMGRKFTIITDHQPLLGIFNPAKKMPDILSPRLIRICLILSAHDYDIVYRPGKQIANADGLSRWPMPVTPAAAETPGDILLMAETPEDMPFDIKDIAQATLKDPLLSKVTYCVLKGWPAKETDKDLHTYWLRRQELSIQDGCVLLGTRVVLPPNMREAVLKFLHYTHSGIVHTKGLARSYVWWPQLDQNIEEMVASCEKCLQNRNMPVKTSHDWIMPCRPWSRIHIDFAGPFQNKIFLIVVDAYSKWPEVHIVSSMSTAVVIKHLRSMFAQHGLCETLVSDNGTAFVSREFENFLLANKIKHIRTAPYHPATNGQAERMVQTIKTKLKKMTDSPWDVKLPRILLTLRTTPSTSTGKSPAELLMNRQLRTLLDSIHPSNARERKVEHQVEQNALKRTRKLEIGNVMYRNYARGPKWLPGTIIDKEGPSQYRITPANDGDLVRRHIDQLIAVRGNEPLGQGKTGKVGDGE